MTWLSFTSGSTSNEKLFGDYGFWRENFQTMYEQYLPYQRLDSVVGNGSTVFQKWLQHPTPDAFWDALVPTPAQYQQLNIPILTITGHFDGDQFGALHYYRQHMQYGSAAARQQHYLIMGPYNHPGTRTPVAKLGGLEFSPNAVLDLNKLHKEWYDFTMKGGPRPAFLQKRVACYVMGPDTWKYADDLESLALETQPLYLGALPGQAHDAYTAGSLGAARPPAKTTPAEFVNDPPDNSSLHDTLPGGPPYLDQRHTLAPGRNGLVYQSAPFADDIERTGKLKLKLWLALNVPNTDLTAMLYEIKADGTALYLTQTTIRARYRESLRQAKLV